MNEAASSNPDKKETAPAGEAPRPGVRVVARLYGEPMTELPEGLYIPPDALEVILERFEGPLDLLLWLIRSQKFDVMDIPMTKLTEQYMAYVELIRRSNLELASAYLVMSATLMAIKSRMLLPKRPDAQGVKKPRTREPSSCADCSNTSACVKSPNFLMNSRGLIATFSFQPEAFLTFP